MLKIVRFPYSQHSKAAPRHQGTKAAPCHPSRLNSLPPRRIAAMHQKLRGVDALVPGADGEFSGGPKSVNA